MSAYFELIKEGLLSISETQDERRGDKAANGHHVTISCGAKKNGKP